MKFTIDRIEASVVIVESEQGEFYELPKTLFPDSVAEGDIYQLTFLKEETSARKKNMQLRLRKLFSK